MMFKAYVKNRYSKNSTFIESDYKTKAKFIEDLRNNGYMINPDKVKPSDLYNWILDNTDCSPLDWKYINKIPQSNDEYREMINSGMDKSDKKREIKRTQLIQECDNSHKQFLQDIGMTEEQFQEWTKENKAKKELGL